MKALFIEVKNWALGERAQIDNSDIEDGNLVCLGGTQHQSLDSMPKGNYEVRVVKDDRDLSEYKGEIVLADGSTLTDPSELKADDDIVDVNGVVVLNGKDQINRVIENAIPPQYRVPGNTNINDIQNRLQEKGKSVKELDNYVILKRAHGERDEKVRKVNPPKV